MPNTILGSCHVADTWALNVSAVTSQISGAVTPSDSAASITDPKFGLPRHLDAPGTTKTREQTVPRLLSLHQFLNAGVVPWRILGVDVDGRALITGRSDGGPAHVQKFTSTCHYLLNFKLRSNRLRACLSSCRTGHIHSLPHISIRTSS